MENTGTATYIERIEIEGLWGRFDVDWKLNPDVNVLIGKNGTGKTTILNLISYLEKLSNMRFKHFPSPRITHKMMTIYFSDDTTSIGEWMADISIPNPNPNPEAVGYSKIKNYTVSGQFNIDIAFLNTFEIPLLQRDDYETEKKPEIETTLDKVLEDLIDAYLDYQLNQSQKALRKEKSIDDAFAKRTYFIETLNRLFADSGKIVDEKQNRISFLIGDKPISAYQLSSGEKQLLILLLTVLTQDEKPSVLLLDEPESSLHLDWQYELINILRTLNPNCQLIIVTHSPSIFTDGHKPKVFWIEDILHPAKQEAALVK